MASSSEEHHHHRKQEDDEEKEKESLAYNINKEKLKERDNRESVLHKTKTIHFFGRSTPIVLQNDNGPCPLLAICNVLLLRNQLNLNPDISEISQEKLLSMVAEKLIDSNSNVNNKDAGYVENQQQNISDAIDLLPRLTTGIDVNTKFRRIDDFEFTPECAIFDLLDIPLYHGWLVDPQDHETAEAISSKSYNSITSALVLLETLKMEKESKDKVDGDCVDFAAATTATLGVPSPSLSRAKSFDDSPRSTSDQHIPRKGDAEEAAELLRVLQLSENDSANDSATVDFATATTATLGVSSPSLSRAKSFDDSPRSTSDQHIPIKGDAEEAAELLRVLKLSENDSANNSAMTSIVDLPLPSDENSHMMKSLPVNHVSLSEDQSHNEVSKMEPSVSGRIDLPENCGVVEDQASPVPISDVGERHSTQLNGDKPVQDSLITDSSTCTLDTSALSEATPSLTLVKDTLPDQVVESLSTSTPNFVEGSDKENGDGDKAPITGSADSYSFIGRIQGIEAVESFTSSLDSSEPLYEGEECVLDTGKTICENQEPVYEGEVVLAEQENKGKGNGCDTSPKDALTAKQGELISSFLKCNPSQLTFYGLFCLQEGLKERELCVFFRNNHFSTMFKFEGSLYLLATDQGYMNQPDLVWEKLNEVNGDTLFMTSNFKEFKLDTTESSTTRTWDQQNAVASTADFLATIDSSSPDGSNMNSDLQLAIALQQQEFDQEQQQQSQQPQRNSASAASRLITGPQVPRNSAKASSSSSRQDQKSKDKSSNCKLM